MKSIVVVGIGNKLMMDDGIGVYIVDKLNSEKKESNVQYILGETDVWYCLEVLNKADFSIIIDAAFLELPPGSIVRFPLSDVLDSLPIPLTAHEFDLFHEMKRDDFKGKGVLIGIQPYRIGFSLGLSEPLAEDFDQIFTQVSNIIEKICQDEA